MRLPVVVRLRQRGKLRAFHANVRSLRVCFHASTPARLDQESGHLPACRLVASNVRHNSTSKTRCDAPARATEELIEDQGVEWMQSVAQGSHGAYRQNPFHAQRLHRVNIRPVIDLARQNSVALPMPRQECNAFPFERPNHKCVRWIAKWRFHAHFLRVSQSCHRVQAAAADDSNPHVFAGGFFSRALLSFCHFASPWHCLECCEGSADFDWLGVVVSITFAQIRGAHHGIVRKQSQPTVIGNPRQPFLFVFERRQRIQIESHYPRQRQMRRGRHQVREKHCGLSAAFEFHALHRRRMSRRWEHAHAGNNFLLAFDQPPLACFFDRHIIFKQETGAVALRRLFCRLQVFLLHEVTRFRKRRARFTIHNSRIPTAMIEMQMRVDDEVDVFRSYSVRGKLVRKSRRTLEGINLPALLVPFVTRTRFHQIGLSRRAYKQAIHREQNPVPLVGARLLFPHRLWYHAKHRAAVEAQRPVIQHQKFQVPQSQRVAPNSARSSISFTAEYGSRFRSATSVAIVSKTLLFAKPSATRRTTRSRSKFNNRSFHNAISFARRSFFPLKCFLKRSICRASSSIPSPAVATVKTIGGFHPSRSGTICKIARSCCSNRSAPSRSALFSTKTSAISISPAFRFCTSSPIPGTRTTSVQSASRAISTSPCPTPTVSINTYFFPAASSSNAASLVACDNPPSEPRVAIERMNTPLSEACPCIRMRSPRIAPPVNGLDGSTAITPTVCFCER